MRRLLFAAALLSASAVNAQVLSDEIVSTPLRARLVPASIAAPAVTVAKDDSGVAIAWTMSNGAGADRIYVTRLNDAAQAESVREIPLSTAAVTVHETSPSLAASADGKGFVLAWLEIDPAMPKFARSLFCRLDAALTPSAPTVLLDPVLSAWPALARTKGDTTWISAGGFVWPLKDGKLGTALAGIGSSDMTVSTDAPQLVGGHGVKSTSYTCVPGCAVVGGPFRGYCRPDCQIFGPDDTALDFTALFAVSSSTTFQFYSDAKPAIASNGSDVLVAWFRGTQTSGGDVVVTRWLAPFAGFTFNSAAPIGSFYADDGETRADIAADGNSYVVVWRVNNGARNHDIVGAMVDKDGKLTPLSIATSAADERDPAVLALGGGNFLVAYEKFSGTERRVAGRFISFGSVGRRRAAR
ncbi:MAG TPA: hypothetical protein VG323_13160 [Thermoanaerobaculia bacterium]|nr:hypothetical protein [Thermoanaerobaculia bacterium]